MTFWEFLISHKSELIDQTLQHLKLTLVSISLAAFVGVVIGIMLAHVQKLSTIVLGTIGVIQTIPSLAMLGFLLPIMGIGSIPAITALFFYALLPIVRNTYTGIKEIDPGIKEATIGMGMSRFQLLRYVELPLAFPVILAGIRTSSVINVGIATLCALIAAGGLGEFIFRGISLNNSHMILAGAVPASLLAILIDEALGAIQKYYRSKWSWAIMLIVCSSLLLITNTSSEDSNARLVAGFNAEFIERADGFSGLDSRYDLPMEIKEMEISLMYKALHEHQVDVIDGFSTDGRIQEYNLALLEDDKGYFPPYYAIPLVLNRTLNTYPELETCFLLLENRITDSLMASLNYRIDGKQESLKQVANDFLKSIGVYANPDAGSHKQADIIIGSKAFTENFLLAYIFAQLIENKTNLKTQFKLGFGGTKLVFDALRYGEIDIYPEYTGTAYLVLLNKAPNNIDGFENPDSVFQSIKTGLLQNHEIATMPPLGFNNTFALMMRKSQRDSLKIHSISELSDYLTK